MNRPPGSIAYGLACGWRVFGDQRAAPPATLDCDVAIVGSGAGAGVTAEPLAQAGLSIAIVEEGPFKSSSDFRQLEFSDDALSPWLRAEQRLAVEIFGIVQKLTSGLAKRPSGRDVMLSAAA